MVRTTRQSTLSRILRRVGVRGCRWIGHRWEMTSSRLGNEGGDISEWLNRPEPATWNFPAVPRGNLPAAFVEGLPSREVEFTCAECGQKHRERRWAFLHGSGSLLYFQLPGEREDRAWPHPDS